MRHRTMKNACAFFALSAFVAGCSSTQPKVGLPVPAPATNVNSPVVSLASIPTTIDNGPTAGEESFSAAAYGVAASPRMVTGVQVPRGGGYAKLGSAYTVKGRRYSPTENQPPKQIGRASWYGAAFHGRLTANGETFDMNHLTAAHKTMPLPSYARVTNTANGRSVIVRVNDRGPFSNKRIIDLSKRGAELLDYTKAGTAEVQVEYIGPAPLHGQDDEYLIASFRGAPTDLLPGVRPVYAQNTSLDISAYADMRVKSAFDMQRFQQNNMWRQLP